MKKKVITGIIILLISVAFLALFSTSTSPIYNYYEDDSAIFITVGKMLKNGSTLYKDIFDHKGPVFFFIQYLGQVISYGRFGIFILQVISFGITNLLLGKIISKIFGSKKSILSILFSLPLLVFYFEEGNLTEEFSLPFISLGLLIALSWYKSNNKYEKNCLIYSFIFGILFSIIAFIRLNNAIAIFGLMIAITITFIKDKKYKELLKCALCFLAGLLLIFGIVSIYFIATKTFYDMIYATFIHNFLYMGTSASLLEKLLNLFPLIILVLINVKNKNMNLMLWIATIFTILIGLIGRGFMHYYIIDYPLFVLFLNMFFDSLNFKENKAISIFSTIIFALIIIVYITYAGLRVCRSIQSNQLFIDMENAESLHKLSIDKLVEEIPIEEKNSFLVYNSNVGGAIYAKKDLFPCYKYAFLQDYLFEANTDIENEMYDYIKSNNVKWILTYDLSKKEKTNKVDSLILEEYREIDSCTAFFNDNIFAKTNELYLYKKK